MPTLTEAKTRLDLLIEKARVHLYKPIQIAEVLRQIRLADGIDPLNIETYRNASIHWRDVVTDRLLGRRSSSSARYQHDVWNNTAMPPALLAVLSEENKNIHGAVERYIYLQFLDRQATVTQIMAAVDAAQPQNFQLKELIALFEVTKGIRRSIDKAYEIVTYALLETVITSLEATVTVRGAPDSQQILTEFAELVYALLGIEAGQWEATFPAHLYRSGVTNAADRGLDMWANFGPAVQVKHLTLSREAAEKIVDQVESDHVVIVCKDAHAETLEIVLSQIGWGQRVRGILKESDLTVWYEKCLRGKFAAQLAMPLLEQLRAGFRAEFPQVAEGIEFCKERGYLEMNVPDVWQTSSDTAIQQIDSKERQ